MKPSSLLYLLLLFGLGMIIQSCVVQHPRYAKSEDVMKVTTGMSVDSVNAVLGMGPNDLVSVDTSGTKVLLYKYRVTEVKRVTPGMRRNKGVEVEGHFKELLLTTNRAEEVVYVETREEAKDSQYKSEKVDPNVLLSSITTFFSVTLPALMVYFSLGGN